MDGSTARNAIAASGNHARSRLKLARKWAYLLSKTTYVPIDHAELERHLLGMVDNLCVALLSDPLPTRLAEEAGAKLVELRCTDRSSLRCTMEVLGKSLPTQAELRYVDKLSERTILLLGAMAAGYAEAIRLATLHQQEELSLALRNVEVNLSASEAKYDQVVSTLTSGIATIDLAGGFVQANDALVEILGYPLHELVQFTLFDVILPLDARAVVDAHRKLLETDKSVLRMQLQLVRKGGELASVSLTSSLIRTSDGEPSYFHVIVEDNTEIHLLRSEISRQALHDVLTGLPNRQFFMTHLEQVISTVNLEHGVTLYHLDLDGFSLVNRGFGRHVGERLLAIIADRLNRLMAKQKAMVVRLDGDEFAILVENSPTTPNALEMVERINEVIAEPTYIDGHGIAVSASIGIVDRPPLYMGVADLLGAAEMTLRRAKSQGHRQWGLYDPSQDAIDRENFRLATIMPGAWENGEIIPVYQSIVSLQSDPKTVGLEALFRWDRSGNQSLSHDMCVQLADRTGLILPLGKRLIQVASAQLQKWHQHIGSEFVLAIGLTDSQASDAECAGDILHIIDETGIPATRLQIGMSTRMLRESTTALDNLQVLADNNVRIALLDFGSAPTELLCLEDLSVHAVRVDRRLVNRQLDRDEKDPYWNRALSELVTMAHNLGAVVIVDGIAAVEQADWWRHAGADLAQGSLYAEPTRAADIASLLDLR